MAVKHVWHCIDLTCLFWIVTREVWHGTVVGSVCGDGGNPFSEPYLPCRRRYPRGASSTQYTLSQSEYRMSGPSLVYPQVCLNKKVFVKIVIRLMYPPWFIFWIMYCSSFWHLFAPGSGGKIFCMIDWWFEIGLKQTVSVLLRKLRYSNELGERNTWLENGETNYRKINCPAGATRTIPDKPKYNRKYTPPDWSKWIHSPSSRLN